MSRTDRALLVVLVLLAGCGSSNANEPCYDDEIVMEPPLEYRCDEP